MHKVYSKLIVKSCVNINKEAMIKNVKLAELNISIAVVFLSTQVLKVI